MNVSAKFSFWAGIVFAVACGSYGLYGLSTLGSGLTDAERSDALGFSMFWLFLAAIGAAMSFVSWLIYKGRLGGSTSEGGEQSRDGGGAGTG